METNKTTDSLKKDLNENLTKLAALRDEVKLKIHLATLDAKQEWDEKLSPRVLEAEDAAKNIAESSRSTLNEVVAKVEDFLSHLRKHEN